MVTYGELLSELESLSEEQFARFNRKIINDSRLKILGVRTPALRKLAKKYSREYENISRFPDEFYEVVFLKLSIAALLPYEKFITECDGCVELISDWALCDYFAPVCIKKRRDDFIPSIKKYLRAERGYFCDGEFVRRFALTTLLHFYVDGKYLDLIFDSIASCKPDKYYTAMGAAWLLADVLIYDFSAGYEFMNSTMCDINVKLKAISKACDSFRVTLEQKQKLRALRAEIRGECGG